MNTSNANTPVSDPAMKLKHLQSMLKPGVDVASLWTTPRNRCFLDLSKKAQILAYCDTHYPKWRDQACKEAEPFLTMTTEQARRPRALKNIQSLGKAWWATDDPKYAQAYEQIHLNSPTGDLFNWGAFAGGQAAHEFPAYLLMQDCPAFSEQGRIAVLDHLFELTRVAWEERTSRWSLLMLGPEGHNWYIHGIHALPFICTVFPELAKADYFLRTSWSVVEEHLRGNYHRDGGSRERTPGYHAGTIGCIWSMYAALKHNQHHTRWQPSAAFESLLLRSTHFSIHSMTPLGGVPAFGDSGGQSGALAHMLSLAATVSGDGLCKWAAEHSRQQHPQTAGSAKDQLPASVFWGVGPDGAEQYAKITPTQPKAASTCLPDSGFAVMRQNLNADAAGIVINAAPRGSIVTSHEHNDIFSFDLFAKGQRFLGQAGIADYSSLPGRMYDVSTRAHNCLTIQGEEQLPLDGEWRWKNTVIPAIRRWDVTEQLEIFHGVHEGFYSKQRPMLHERKIIFIKPDVNAAGLPASGSPSPSPYWVILDRVIAETNLPYEIWFHGCVPGRITSSQILLQAAPDNMLLVSPPAGDELTLRQDQGDDVKAYAVEAMFDLENHPAYCYESNTASHVFAWVLMPVTSSSDLPVIERLPCKMEAKPAADADMTALRISHPVGTGNAAAAVVDEICMSHLPFDAMIDYSDQPAVYGQTVLRRTIGGQTSTTIRSTLDGSQAALV